MSKIHVATIITPDHLDKAYTMLESMRQFQDCHLHILLVAGLTVGAKVNLPANKNVTFYYPNDLFEGQSGRLNRLIFSKYSVIEETRPSNIAPLDYLRWALKPGFTHFLLKKFDKIIHCDCDLHFYNDFEEIIDYASDKSLVISPHWRTIHSMSSDELRYNFIHGLYNAGFFIATQKAGEILEWWSERCCVECSATSGTTYVDQKYLDLVPLYFENVGIIRHKGYNVAAWNANYLKRTIENGIVLVEGQPIIFIHYSPITIIWIENKTDPYLIKHLAEYKQALLKQQTSFYRESKQQFTTIDTTQINII